MHPYLRSFAGASLREGWRRLSLAALLLGLAHAASAQVTPVGSLGNFDVRYGPINGVLPDDLDIYLYGDGLTCDDVVWTWNTDILLGGAGLQWGRAICGGPVVNTDPTSPAFGLDCIRVRYAGPERPAMIGRLVHAGVHLRPGTQIEHQEIWWTKGGERIRRPCDPHIRWVWHRTTRTWIICIANPTAEPFYVYGYRWFLPFPTLTGQVVLPTLNELQTGMRPEAFQTQWQPIPDVATGVPFPRIVCIPPWCRIYIRIQIPITICRPIVFQVGLANSDFGGNPPVDPAPDDERTAMIVTMRPSERPDADIDADGVVGIRDRNLLRSEYLQESQDNVAPPDPMPTGGGQD